MSLKDCISRKVAMGVLDTVRAAELAKRLDTAERLHLQTMTAPVAARQAELDVVAALNAEAIRKRDLMARTVLTQTAIMQRLAEYDDPVRALRSLMMRDLKGDNHGHNVDKLKDQLRANGHKALAEALYRWRPTTTGGVRDRIGQGNLVRAIFAEHVPNDPGAMAAAKAWHGIAEKYRTLAKAAGIDIPNLTDWRLPQRWDSRRVRDAGFEAWRKIVEPLLDEKTFARQESKLQGINGEVSHLSKEIDTIKAERDAVAEVASRKREELRRVKAQEERSAFAVTRERSALKELMIESQRQLNRYGDTGPTRPYLDDRKRRTSAEVARDKRQAPKARETGRNLDHLAERRAKIHKRLLDAEQRLAEAKARRAELEPYLKQSEAHLADWGKRLDDLAARRTAVGKAGDGLRGEVTTAQGREDLLRAAYETISSNGWNKVDPNAGGGGVSLANKYRDAHRVLHFKDATGWMEAQRAFGDGTPPIGVILDHMDGMSHDIAMATIWGPNPQRIFDWAVKTIEKQAHASGQSWIAIDKLKLKLAALKAVFRVVKGDAATPTSERVAMFGQGMRSVLVSQQLGGAFISSITDIGTMALTAAFNGLPATSVAKMVVRSVRMMVDGGDQVAAVKLGLLAEGWGAAAADGVRYAGDKLAAGWSTRLAHTVMEASLLAPATRARKWAFGMETLSALRSLTGKDWKDLPARLQDAFERYDLDAGAWDVIRQAPAFVHRGVEFLDIEAVGKVGDPRAEIIAGSLSRLIMTESDYAVISTDPLTRAIITGGGMPAGTITGELARFFGVYKAYGITAVTTHLMRGLSLAKMNSKAAYLAAFAGSLTVLGMVALQSKQIQRGKDPLPLDDWATWGKAFMQGGGAGILGDFLTSESSRFGGGLAETLAGPAVGAVSDTVRVATAWTKGEPDAWRQTVAYAGRMIPGSSLWYTRLALERLVLDQLALMDPKTRTGFARLERKMRKENNQGFWWKQGNLTPSRAPAMGNLTE
jgi:hypothetical protein